jgi:hypothetical protein
MPPGGGDCRRKPGTIGRPENNMGGRRIVLPVCGASIAPPRAFQGNIVCVSLSPMPSVG